MDTLVRNARLLIEDRLRPAGWVLVHGGLIADLGCSGSPPWRGVVDHAQQVDLDGAVLAPGLIDLHVHGALGHDTMDATPEGLREIAQFLARHGVTSFLATTMAERREAILSALENIAAVMQAGTGGAMLLGAHLEGPYLNSEQRGCQDPTHIRRAESAEYEAFFDTDVIRLLTVAPERPGMDSLIRFARSRSVAVSAGHTRASYDQMVLAVSMGVTQVTHLFNAMQPMHHRRPGAVGAALTLDALRCQLIADNVHVHPAMLELVHRCKGSDGIVLVTDAMSGAGMPDGEYSLGGLFVTVNDGVARIRDGSLAGSTLTLERGVRNMAQAAGLTLPQALAMATRTPARALGIGDHKGAIAVGMDADLVAMDDDANVILTMVGGEIVFGR